MSKAGNTAATYAALRTAAHVADHWFQTSHQAMHKADEGLAATHWFIDRRWPVRKLCDVTGKRGFHDLGGPLGGAYILDQSTHHLMEAVAAVIASRD